MSTFVSISSGRVTSTLMWCKHNLSLNEMLKIGKTIVSIIFLGEQKSDLWNWIGQHSAKIGLTRQTRLPKNCQTGAGKQEHCSQHPLPAQCSLQTWSHPAHQTCGLYFLPNKNLLSVQVIQPHQHSSKDTYFLLFLTPDICPLVSFPRKFLPFFIVKPGAQHMVFNKLVSWI